MTHLEEALRAGGGPWICGPDYSLADICVAPILDRVEHLDLAGSLEGLAGRRGVVRTDEGTAGLPARGAALRVSHVGPGETGPRSPVDPAAAGNTFPAG